MNMNYELPEGDCVLGVSGGRTSGFMLRKYLDRYNGHLPNRCQVHFQNTGMEMPETLDFVRDMSVNWGVNIIWLEYYCPHPSKRPSFKVVDHATAFRDGTPFKQLIDKRGYLPNIKERFCTSELKILTSKRYMVSQGFKKWHSAVGFRYDEPSRVKKNKKEDTRIIPYYPLIKAKITKRHIFEYWNNSPFDLALENNNGTTPMGNCTICFLKSEKTKAYVCRHYPQMAGWAAYQENKIGGTFRDKQPWQHLIDFVDRQSEFNFSDEQDIYCDNDLGGCTDY